MRCNVCQFWDSDGYCDRVDQWRSPIVFDIDVEVSDDTGLRARLKTGPDFGCVLFQPKPTNNLSDDE